MLVGSAGWLVIGAPALRACGVDLDPAELVAGTVVCAGASMLPDLDHPQATASRSLGPITGAASRVLRTVSGGHRQGTHSLLFAALAGVGSAALLAGTSGPWASFLICFFFASLLFRVLTEANGAISAALAMLVSGGLLALTGGGDWIWLAVLLGCLFHMLGDILTPEGVPPLWPILPKWRLSVHVIGHTGDWREWVIGSACGLLAMWFLLTGVFLPVWKGQQTAKAETVPAKTIKKQSASHPKKHVRRGAVLY